MKITMNCWRFAAAVQLQRRGGINEIQGVGKGDLYELTGNLTKKKSVLV
jgi:hypothetical protein